MKTGTPFGLSPQSYHGGITTKYDYSSDKTTQLKLEEFLPPLIFKKLMQFQRSNIKKAVKLHGRIFINDGPTGGKTLSAIGAALAYKQEWPLVVITADCLKFHWRYEIMKWLPGLCLRKDIQVLQGRQMIRHGIQILILSHQEFHFYEKRLKLLGLKVVILDEAQIF